MKTKNSVRFGVVKSFRGDRGWLEVSGEARDIWFDLDSQRTILAGFSAPHFGSSPPRTSVMPQKGAQVACMLDVGYELDTSVSGVRTLRRFVRVIAWNFARAYQVARQEIEERPVYEVWEFNLYKGEPVSGRPSSIIASGTALELQADYPRGEKNDPLVSETHCMDLVVRHRFCKRGERGNWRPDPRPLPAGAVAQPVPPVNSHGVLLPSEEALRSITTPEPGKGNGDVGVSSVEADGGEDTADGAELLALAASAGGRRAGTTTIHPHRRW